MNFITHFCIFLLFANAPLLAADMAPDFALRDIKGKKFKLSGALGKGPILVDFWATWCEPCKAELPSIQKLHETYAEKGLQVVAISTDGPKSQSKVKPFIRGSGYTFNVLFDPDQEVRKLFGGTTTPYTVLLSPEGEIFYRHLGYSPGDEITLEAEVKKSLGIDEASAAEEELDAAENESED